MEKISQGYSFLLKNEEYSLDIIFNYQTPNGISYKGITIQKKNCEIKALNNENLNNLFNAKEILPNNYIESLANIGLISISGMCTASTSTKSGLTDSELTESAIALRVAFKILISSMTLWSLMPME